MPELDFEVNAEILETKPAPKPLDPGLYEGEIIGCEQRVSGKGHKYLAVQVDVNGKWIYENINLWHPKESVVEIANRTFTQIGVALGMSKITDTEQLLARRALVDVRVRKDENGNDKNYIFSWAAAPFTPPANATPPHPQGTAEVDNQATLPAWGA